MALNHSGPRNDVRHQSHDRAWLAYPPGVLDDQGAGEGCVDGSNMLLSVDVPRAKANGSRQPSYSGPPQRSRGLWHRQSNDVAAAGGRLLEFGSGGRGRARKDASVQGRVPPRQLPLTCAARFGTRQRWRRLALYGRPVPTWRSSAGSWSRPLARAHRGSCHRADHGRRAKEKGGVGSAVKEVVVRPRGKHRTSRLMSKPCVRPCVTVGHPLGINRTSRGGMGWTGRHEHPS